ncbi:hypothetical protein B296_00013988 [Ensete ventricosum]|uniref:Uncharacterized protein n=1 Tax=Ensete ventricosum TaxID=4639 RepID=A0A427ASX8_ENSVE|nr:hypothetical protein B296_00013988 [Ensete ventricosum]
MCLQCESRQQGTDSGREDSKSKHLRLWHKVRASAGMRCSCRCRECSSTTAVEKSRMVATCGRGAATKEVEEGEATKAVFCSWSFGSREKSDERGVRLHESKEGSSGHGKARGSYAGSRRCQHQQGKR